MESCGCPAQGRHKSECQKKPPSPMGEDQMRVLELKSRGMNSLQVYEFLKKRNSTLTPAQVNKFYATALPYPNRGTL